MTLKQLDNPIIDHPQDVARDLQRFRRRARFLSSRRASLVKRYPKEWVAIYDSKVKAHARTLVSLMEQVDRQGLPHQHTVVGFINTSKRKLIL